MIDHPMIVCCQECEQSVSMTRAEFDAAPRSFRCDLCLELEREPQGEAVRLFTPAPTQIAGQTGFGF